MPPERYLKRQGRRPQNSSRTVGNCQRRRGLEDDMDHHPAAWRMLWSHLIVQINTKIPRVNRTLDKQKTETLSRREKNNKIARKGEKTKVDLVTCGERTSLLPQHVRAEAAAPGGRRASAAREARHAKPHRRHASNASTLAPRGVQ